MNRYIWKVIIIASNCSGMYDVTSRASLALFSGRTGAAIHTCSLYHRLRHLCTFSLARWCLVACDAPCRRFLHDRHVDARRELHCALRSSFRFVQAFRKRLTWRMSFHRTESLCGALVDPSCAVLCWGMRRDTAFSTVLQLCKSLCLPTQFAPGMFGAFCFASFSSGQALPLTEPALAAATRQFSHVLCASNTKAPKTLSRTAVVRKLPKRSLHTTDLPVADQQATASQQVISTIQLGSTTNAAAESSSQASSLPHRTAKQTYRKAKDGPKEPSSSTDLRCVNGVGPKNEALLLKIGLSSVDRLKDMYKVDHNCNTSALKAYLQVKYQKAPLHSA